MREKIELEYTLNCSPRVLFSRLSTPEGLAEWFADDVTAEGDIFTFKWLKSETRARLAALKENKLVRFEWPDKEEDGSHYFEFRIIVHELTGDVALIVTDFAETSEKDDTINLWNTQINDLRRLLGT
ncbi:MAG TPA: START-like domain-containing protein [Bacteroidales bacterium]|nr:START-like domain-containing protein [Bacteroidales bacterium]HRT90719.1 START-like domain-containing protein [Bacteroidales bacterium]